MDSSDFSVLVGRLERGSADHPRLYLAKVAMVMVLGYAPMILFVAGFMIAWIALLYSLLTAGRTPALAVMGGLACVAAVAVIVRALIVKVDFPQGRPITREEAPALFAAIDDVIQRAAATQPGKAQAVVIDSVTLDGVFDTSLSQIPRWGPFGNYTNHLQLGVPLLTALSIAELKALLAHEIGHVVVGAPGPAFAAWIYRQRLAWRALQEKFDEPANVVDRILAVFYGWYCGYFHAYTFVLARNQQYAADRLSAKATHPGALAHALTKLALMGRFLEEVFWNRLWGQIEQHPEPQYLPYSMMPRAFGIARVQWARKDWLESSLRKFSAEGDTHPSLGERFEALRIEPTVPTYSADRSALSLFGAHAAAVLAWCDEEWRAQNATKWRKRHDAIKEIRWKIAEYERTPEANLKPEDLWQKALLVLDLGHIDTAIDELQVLVARDPAMAKAHLLLGKLRLQHGDEQGLQSLVLAAAHDVEMIEEAGGMGYGYLINHGRKREAERFWERVRAA